jgi:hypothetical protein
MVVNAECDDVVRRVAGLYDAVLKEAAKYALFYNERRQSILEKEQYKQTTSDNVEIDQETTADRADRWALVEPPALPIVSTSVSVESAGQSVPSGIVDVAKTETLSALYRRTGRSASATVELFGSVS